MKMKRILALVAAGVMTISACMVVSAAPSSSSVSGNRASSSSSKKTEVVKEELTGREAEIAREAAAHAQEIAATGIPYSAWCAAAEGNKSIEEYFSNSVMELQGLDEVTPVGQGGGVVLDGQASNVSFAIDKPVLAYVDSAKAQAAALGGEVLNVVKVSTTAVFGTAAVNFYMPGVTAEQNIQVYQYADGQWTALNVAEVRADHVVVDITSLGTIAFIEVQ